MPDTRSVDRREQTRAQTDEERRRSGYRDWESGGYGYAESAQDEDNKLDTYYDDDNDGRTREATREVDSSGTAPLGIPEEIWGALDGGARAQYMLSQQEAERNRNVLHNLADTIPYLDDLSVDYAHEGMADEAGSLMGGSSQLQGFGPSDDQQASLRALRGLYESGGYTDADRNMSRAMRDQQAQNYGAQNAAAMQQMQARGMGGSGAELAMRMQAGDSMAGANSMADAQLQQAGMQRALQSLQGYQSGANTIQQQELARRGALDAFNQSNMDWRRGRSQRNTGYTNASRESRAQSQRDQYGMRQGLASLHLGHNPNGSQSAGENASAAQRGIIQGAIGATGEVLGELL